MGTIATFLRARLRVLVGRLHQSQDLKVVRGFALERRRFAHPVDERAKRAFIGRGIELIEVPRSFGASCRPKAGRFFTDKDFASGSNDCTGARL